MSLNASVDFSDKPVAIVRIKPVTIQRKKTDSGYIFAYYLEVILHNIGEVCIREFKFSAEFPTYWYIFAPIDITRKDIVIFPEQEYSLGIVPVNYVSENPLPDLVTMIWKLFLTDTKALAGTLRVANEFAAMAFIDVTEPLPLARSSAKVMAATLEAKNFTIEEFDNTGSVIIARLPEYATILKFDAYLKNVGEVNIDEYKIVFELHDGVREVDRAVSAVKNGKPVAEGNNIIVPNASEVNIYPEDTTLACKFDYTLDRGLSETLPENMTLKWKLFLPNSKPTEGVVNITEGFKTATKITDND